MYIVHLSTLNQSSSAEILDLEKNGQNLGTTFLVDVSSPAIPVVIIIILIKISYQTINESLT